MTTSSHSGISDRPELLAVKNLEAALVAGRRLPANVFHGQWSSFLFFDPDLLFELQSASRLQTLLTAEGGSTVCIRNLDVPCPKGQPEYVSIFLNKETSAEAYMAELKGTEPGSGWLYRMDRYGYSSDSGNWCIYCERNNEIAVVAVRQNFTRGHLATAFEKLNALPIERAVEKPASYGLSSRGLPLQWREKLLQEYAANA